MIHKWLDYGWFKTGQKVSVKSVFSPGSGLSLFMGGVAHGAELGHKEVVAAVVGRRVLLNVGKLHKLDRGQEDEGNIR